MLVSWRPVLALSLLALLATRLTARPGAAASAPAPAAETLTVEITAYASVPGQTDATPHVTASGAPAGPGTVAVSRDLLERFPYGSHLEVVSVSGEGCGGWTPETP